jgi:hypothetical protein
MKTFSPSLIKNLKFNESEKELPVEILRKLRRLIHLRPREVKRLRKWAFFDL